VAVEPSPPGAARINKGQEVSSWRQARHLLFRHEKWDGSRSRQRRQSCQERVPCQDRSVQCHPQLDKEQAMQTIADVMTREVQSIAPSESIQRAAQLMDELNVGALPVCEGQKLIGIVTDRDITVRATSAGQMPEDATVETVMSTDVRVCHPQQTVDQVLDEMGDVQIRRVPVVDPDTRKLIGIVSLGDMATRHSAGIDHTLENISSPSRPERGQSPGSGMQR
jgi:CBS domain-containing protein